MSNTEPLRQGQEVFLKRPLQIYAKVIGPLEGDFGYPEGQARYSVQLMPLEQIYLSEDLELATYLQLISPRPDYVNSGSANDGARSSEAVMNLSAADSFFERAQETDNLIARRAYELFEDRGFTDGHDTDDWHNAVSEILLRVPADITETPTQLTVHADVPGVSARDLEIRLAPRSLCIIGKRQALPEQTNGNYVHSERRSNRIFRVLDLPCEINPYGVTATVSNGILEVKLPKTNW